MLTWKFSRRSFNAISPRGGRYVVKKSMSGLRLAIPWYEAIYEVGGVTHPLGNHRLLTDAKTACEAHAQTKDAGEDHEGNNAS
jgi:hypothetical protein